jgi:hypothetical protein
MTTEGMAVLKYVRNSVAVVVDAVGGTAMDPENVIIAAPHLEKVTGYGMGFKGTGTVVDKAMASGDPPEAA